MRLIAFAAAGLLLTMSTALAQVPEAPPAQATPPADAVAPPPAPALPAAETPPAPGNPPMTGPQLLIQTTAGDITLQLDNVRAPQSVAHILRQARAGFYNGTCIYRVEKNFVIQMGSWDAQGKGHGWFARPVPLEANNGLKNYRLSVALPRGDVPTSAGPDFYINMRDNLGLDQKPGDTANQTGFAVFGQVAGGLDVVEAINNMPVGNGKGPFAASEPVTPIVITRISVVGDPPPRPAAAPAPARPATTRPAPARPAPARRTN